MSLFGTLNFMKLFSMTNVSNFEFLLVQTKQKNYLNSILKSFIRVILFVFQVLGSGMNLHLSDNDLVRSIFGLGAPLPALDKLSSKPSKHERVRK